MTKENLKNNVDTFYNEMENRLENLSSKEKQQYLEGLVHAFDAITRYASPQKLTPFEREEFIGIMKSQAYSKTHHLNLDPETTMKGLIESDSEGIMESYLFAAKIQMALGTPLNFEQQHKLDQIVMVYKIDEMKKK